MVSRERILIVLVAALACLGFGCSGPDFSVDSSDATDIGDAGPEALPPLLCPHCQDPGLPTGAGDDGGSADGGSEATMVDGGARTDGGLDAATLNEAATLSEAATLNDATSAGGCSATQKMCASSCVSLDDPKYGCGSGPCIACSADPHATYVCQAGACQATVCQTGYKSCGGVCVTADVAHGCGATACSACGASHGTASCDATGKCAIACDANYKPCGGVCVSLSDPTYGCGDTTCDMSSCPAAGGGTLVCSAKTCQIGSCAAGTKKCGSLCVPTDSNNGCADPARCTACGAMETCAGAPSVCQCVPESMATTCARVQCGHTKNNCGTDVDCGSAACIAPSTCGGGNVANTCGCVDEPAKTTCSGGRCGGQTNNCGHPVACPATSCTAPQTCGGGSAANMCGCTDESTSTTCSAGRCGGQTNNCGHAVVCPATSCTAPQTCGGAGAANMCGCADESTSTTCSGGRCGTQPNNCGRSVACPATSCTAPQTCGGGSTANMCGCTDQSMSTTCSGGRCGAQTNNCGRSVACPACCLDEPLSTTCTGGRCGSQTNNCGHSVSCPATSCTAPQTCGGGSTANMCGCTDQSTSTTCSGGRCGGQTNNCGHSVACPACWACKTGVSQASWDFESNTTDGWTADGPFPPEAMKIVSVSTNHNRPGSTYSITAHLDSSTGPNGGHIGFVSPLCAGTTVNLANRTVLAKIYVEGPALPEDGQARFMAASAFLSGTTTQTASIETPVTLYNQWVSVTFPFGADASDVSTLTININVAPDVNGPAWVGNIYLDDVIIQ